MISFDDDFGSQENLIDFGDANRARDRTSQTNPSSRTQSSTLGENTHAESSHTSRVHFERPSMTNIHVNTNLQDYTYSPGMESGYGFSSPGGLGREFGASAPPNYDESPYQASNGIYRRMPSEMQGTLRQYNPIPNARPQSSTHVKSPATMRSSTYYPTSHLLTTDPRAVGSRVNRRLPVFDNVEEVSSGYSSVKNSQPPGRIKVLEPETFDGSVSGVDIVEYLIHFEQIADWNKWNNDQKAKMLVIKLRGEAQKLLTTLSYLQVMDYSALKQSLIQRFNPKEREITYRCEFRTRIRKGNEQCSDYGYALRRLAQRAYPNLPYNALEVIVIDQFIMGLGSLELQKHVQFKHPDTLNEAISMAMEYTSVCGFLDQRTQPLEMTDKVTSLASLQIRPSCQEEKTYTHNEMEDLIHRAVEKAVAAKFDTVEMGENSSLLNDISPCRKSSNDKYEERGRSPSPSVRNRNTDTPSRPKKEILCSYCGRNNHAESRCFTKLRDYDQQYQLNSLNLNLNGLA